MQIVHVHLYYIHKFLINDIKLAKAQMVILIDA